VKLGRDKDDRSRPAVFLAAFGKHPGWDDHIEDIGIETEHLASLKQLLYVQGIGGTIDSGAWDNLTDAQRHAGFRHVFVCRTPRDVILGRLWSSTDGKGRARYPMVVCAQCLGRPLRWAVREVLPRLEAIQQRCVDVRTAGEVLSILDEARTEYRALAEPAGGEDNAYVVSPRTLAALADRAELGPDQEGLFRILYQIEREMPAYLRGSDEALREEARPIQMRVPVCGDPPAEAVLQWLDFLLGRIDPDVEVWVILPLDEPWLDLFIGHPYPQQFFCFQASREALPLASEIPYNLDEGFLDRSRQLVEASREGRGEEIVIRPDAHSATSRLRIEALDVSGKLAALGRSRGFRMAALAVVAALVLLGLLIAAMSLWPSGGPGRPDGRPPPRVTMDPKAAEAWEELCTNLDAWCARFLADLDRQRVDRWREDPGLLQEILPVLEQVLNGEEKLDPRRFANIGGSTLRLMATRPPKEVRKDPRVIEQIYKARDQVRAIREALSAEGWATRKRLKELAGQFQQRGWEKQAYFVGSAADDVRLAPGLAMKVDEVVAAGRQAERLAAAWGRLAEDVRTVEANGPPLLKEFGKYVEARTLDKGTGGDGGDLEAMRRRLAPIEKLAADLAAFVKPGWRDGLDAAMLEHDPPVRSWTEDDVRGGTVFERWLAAIQGDKYMPVSPDADPRTADWKKRQAEQFASIGKTIQLLKDEHRDPNAAAYVKQAAAMRGEFDAICRKPWNRLAKEQIEQAVPEFERRPADLNNQVNDVLLGYLGGVAAFVENLPKEVSSKSDVLNRTWQERLKEITRDAKSLAKLRPMVKAIRAGLEKLDGELKAALPDTEGDPDWRRRLSGRPLLAQREKVLSRGVALLKWTDQGLARDAKFQAEWTKLAAEFDAWRDEVGAIVTALSRVKDALDQGALLDEAPQPPAKAIAQTYAEVRARPAWKDAAVQGVFQAVTERLDRLAEVAGSTDRKALAAEAVRAVAGRFELARAAWRRLGQLPPPWPATPAELERERHIHRALAAAYALLPDGPRRGALQQELTASTCKRWETYLAGRTDPAESDDAIRQMVEFCPGSGDLAALQPINRFRVGLYRFRQKVLAGARTLDDQAVRKEVHDFLAAAKALGGVVSAGPVAEFLAELGKIAESQDTGADLSKAALAAALPGVGVEAAADGSSAKYTWITSGGERHSLEFVRIEPPGQAPSYLCTTEVTVGLFADVVKAKARWNEFRGMLPTYESRDDDTRPGPRVWQIAEGDTGLVHATSWCRMPPGLKSEEFYAQGIDPGTPRRDDPMQHVSIHAAAYLAALLGARLPTAAEWACAYETYEKADPAATPNLRDKTWARQQANIRKLEESGAIGAMVDQAYPDAGAFWPKDFAPRQERKDAQARTDLDDGLLWFARVGVSKARTFHHLVGNVAEFTFEDAAAAGKLTNPAAEDIRKLVQSAPGSVRVIGGSALSAPALSLAEPYVPDPARASEGFADVGFRLAFTAPAMPLHTRLRRALNQRGYLPSAGVGK